ncbi:MAG: hypothetical protein H6811_08180 [Phycisphaeraceae bacterium]|nr:hypothetical protein [Phycisphaeraceae bacterium]
MPRGKRVFTWIANPAVTLVLMIWLRVDASNQPFGAHRWTTAGRWAHPQWRPVLIRPEPDCRVVRVDNQTRMLHEWEAPPPGAQPLARYDATFIHRDHGPWVVCILEQRDVVVEEFEEAVPSAERRARIREMYLEWVAREYSPSMATVIEAGLDGESRSSRIVWNGVAGNLLRIGLLVWMLVSLLWLPRALLWRLAREKRALYQSLGRCGGCGYEVRDRIVCPECGEPRTLPVRPLPAVVHEGPVMLHAPRQEREGPGSMI